MLDPLLTFSDALVSRVAGSGGGLFCGHPENGAQRTVTVWRPEGLVTSEQDFLPATEASVLAAVRPAA